MIGLRWLWTPSLGADTTTEIGVVLFGAASVVGCLLTLIALPRAGHLLFFTDRAELPQPIRPPWCLLPPRKLYYDQVTRWGTAEVPTSGEPVLVVAFAIASEDGGAERTIKLIISYYPDPDAVLVEFQKRLPPLCRVTIGCVFGGVTFRNRRKKS